MVIFGLCGQKAITHVTGKVEYGAAARSGQEAAHYWWLLCNTCVYVSHWNYWVEPRWILQISQWSMVDIGPFRVWRMKLCYFDRTIQTICWFYCTFPNEHSSHVVNLFVEQSLKTLFTLVSCRHACATDKGKWILKLFAPSHWSLTNAHKKISGSWHGKDVEMSNRPATYFIF